mgnify:CR=1 FL=1
MLSSLCFTNQSRPIRIYVIQDEVPEEALKKLSHSLIHPDLSLHFIDAAHSLFSKLELPLFRGSYATYFRLIISELLPPTEQKVLYLDSDTLILDKLDELFDLSLQDFYLAAVPDQHINYRFKDSKFTHGLFKNSQGLQNGLAFNAGVLLINLEKWRKDEFSKTLLMYGHNYRNQIRVADQDILNLGIGEQWLHLKERWNVQTPTYYRQGKMTLKVSHSEYMEIIRNPGIVHFTTETGRPWDNRCDHPYKKLFKYFFNQTEWKDSNFIESPKGSDLFPLFLKCLKNCLVMRPWLGQNWSGSWLKKQMRPL